MLRPRCLPVPGPCPAIHGGLRVGITLRAGIGDDAWWQDPAQQGALFLCMALQAARNVRWACLVDVSREPSRQPPRDDFEGQVLAGFDDVCAQLDVLIEAGAQVDAAQTETLKRRGIRLVSYCCSADDVDAIQGVLSGRRVWADGLFINQRYDAIWMLPQVADSSRGFFEVLRQRQADVVPLVWDPGPLRRRCAGYERGAVYRPRHGAARLTVMEPNRDAAGFCLYPILIAEQAYRCGPDLVRCLRVTHCEGLGSSNADFMALMSHLDLVRDRKAEFVGSMDPVRVLAEMTDAVVSHQACPTPGHLHLEACWLGYPLIHHAASCSELGYYYGGNDVQQAARLLRDALSAHDASWLDYRARQRELIARHRPDHPVLAQRHARALDDVMQRPLR